MNPETRHLKPTNRSRLWSASVGAVVSALLAGCATVDESPRAADGRRSPVARTAADRRESAVPERDRVLYAYRGGRHGVAAGEV